MDSPLNEIALTNLKERIAIAESFAPHERDFILASINAAVAMAKAAKVTEQMANADATVIVHNVPNYLGRIETLWAALSIDDGGEGLCAAPFGSMTLPLIAADSRRLEQIMPVAQSMAVMFRKPVRIAKFTKREDIHLYRADS